jgi:hypothetical protein
MSEPKTLPRIAVVGVSSLIGEAVLDELRARKFPHAELHALDDERISGGLAGGQPGRGCRSRKARREASPLWSFQFRPSTLPTRIWCSFAAAIGCWPRLTRRRPPRMPG